MTLVGGRNIGDAYFGAGEEPLFSDLDVMAIGPVVNDVANDFERYWRCSSVSTLQQVLSLSEQELTQRIELPESGITMRSPAVICISWKPASLWRISIAERCR